MKSGRVVIQRQLWQWEPELGLGVCVLELQGCNTCPDSIAAYLTQSTLPRIIRTLKYVNNSPLSLSLKATLFGWKGSSNPCMGV